MTSATGGQPVLRDRPDRARRTGRMWTALTCLELALATVAVVRDLLLPTFVLLLMALVSSVVRREGLGALGLHRPAHASRMAAQVLGIAAAWTLLTVGLFMPVVERLAGERQDVSQFAELQGNFRLLILFLVLSWTLAALCEELAFRGYVQTRLRTLLPRGRAGLVAAVALSSVLFGLIHTEQGLVGVVISTVNGAFYSALRYRYRTLWAAVLAHGFSNSIGMAAFYLVGPVYGLW